MSSKWPLSAEGLLSTKCWACSFLCILVFHSQPPYMACATFIKLTPQKGTEAHRSQIRHIQEVTMMGFKPRQLWVGIHSSPLYCVHNGCVTRKPPPRKSLYVPSTQASQSTPEQGGVWGGLASISLPICALSWNCSAPIGSPPFLAGVRLPLH